MLYGFQSAFIFLNYLFDPGSKAVSYVEKTVFIANSLTQDWEKLSELPCIMQLKSDGARPVLMPLESHCLTHLGAVGRDSSLWHCAESEYCPWWLPPLFLTSSAPIAQYAALPNNMDSNHMLVLST